MTLVVDRPADEVVGIWLDRPGRRNAVDAKMVDALHDAFGDVPGRTVVLGSTDATCFCAGADITVSDEERRYVSDRLHELYGRMLALEEPIVAALSGPAVGGGAQLAIASDVRVAAPSTRLRFAGAGHGLVVGAWGLPSLVGRGRTLDLCLSMRWVDAAEAHAIGLVDRIADDARAAAVDLAVDIAANDKAAVTRLKSLVVREEGLIAAVEDERVGNTTSWSGSVAGLQRGSGT